MPRMFRRMGNESSAPRTMRAACEVRRERDERMRFTLTEAAEKRRCISRTARGRVQCSVGQVNRAA